MKISKLHFVAGIAIIFIFVIYLFGNSNIASKNLSPNEFEELINSVETFVINTHTPYNGEITGTDLIAEDWDNMELYLDQLPKDKDTSIAVYCRSGNMAQISIEQLLNIGYTNVNNLEGGMNAWQNSGRGLVFDNYDGPIKEFDVVAMNWEFTPGLIEVNLGDRVMLHVQSVDTYHGIALTDFGISKQLPPGEIVDIEFIADKQGSFSFFCNVPCGSGHSGMNGVLMVN